MADSIQLARQVVEKLCANGHRLGVIESCTGGLLAAAITAVPGASAVFVGGLVAYSNEIKASLVGIDEMTLEGFGAVSGECACEMACNGEMVLGADYIVAITGIAGPDGGTEDKPVGTVFIAWSGPAGVELEHHTFDGDRGSVQAQTVTRALAKLLELLG